MHRFARAPRECVAGLLFMAVGGFALGIGRDYRVGTLVSMGPGYFPRVIALLLVVLGALVLVAGLRRTGPALAAWRLRPLLLVLASLAVFGACLETLGFLPAIVLLILVAAVAEPARPVLETAILILAMTALGWLVFIAGLDLPLKLWPGHG